DDAYQVYAFLKSPEGGAIPENQLKVLVDEDATRQNIIQAMQNTFLQADENDVVMLYFSGHGIDGSFLPIDFDGYNNKLKHYDVKRILEKSKAKHKVCIADACYSGSLLAQKKAFGPSLNKYYNKFLEIKGGTAFLMSSKEEEVSLEAGGLRQGVFSHYVLKGLRGAADSNSNKIVTIAELHKYVHKHVRDYSGNTQTPILAGDYDPLMPVGMIR
ncbi:MAG: caspase family protein, partial [Bacteroidota bacterium]